MLFKHFNGEPMNRNQLSISAALIAFSMAIVFAMIFFLWGMGFSLPCFCFLAFPAAIIFGAIAFISANPDKGPDLPRSKRVVVVIFLILEFGIFLFLFCGGVRTLINLGMQLNVARTGGINKLQSWAMDIFEKPETEIVVDPNSEDSLKSKRIKKEFLSKQVMAICYFSDVYIVSKPQGRYVLIRIGGGGFIEFDWGIIIYLLDKKIEDKEKNFHRWRDGVYGYIGRGL